MSLNAAVNASPQSTRFAGFLAAALALHGLILMLPAQRGLPPERVLHDLSVTLRAVTRPPSGPAADRAEAEPAPATAAAQHVPAPSAVRNPLESRPSAPPPDPAEAPPLPDLSTARLLDLAHRRRWALPEDNEARRLGAPATEVLRRGRGTGQASGEGPAMAAGLQIMDRWFAADGSQNVLIRTPSGRVICGRTEAWDPMRPLVEQVRMLRDCGNGEPTFEWPEMYREDASRRR
jgi:hypothetical protein